MVEISCFHVHYNKIPIYLVFIKYQNYMKIKINNRKPIILSINTFMDIPLLFEFYILSLLCTFDYSHIEIIDNTTRRFSIKTIRYWKHIAFSPSYNLIELDIKKNPLNTKEPKRESGNKKINKFIKAFHGLSVKHPLDLIEEFILSSEYNESSKLVKAFINYQNKITLLTLIKSNYGDDIYSLVHNFM